MAYKNAGALSLSLRLIQRKIDAVAVVFVKQEQSVTIAPVVAADNSLELRTIYRRDAQAFRSTRDVELLKAWALELQAAAVLPRAVVAY
eukprot:CAMPEP_0119335624 /NCGR_PEP_ID=MMETSP1333-20130426/89969_1 /TAXON_ID=418940 /ORGANISM="Scyphosphaera apsteinii, Strain RCC1455" /LENGTH=88 /DNA_ID=CAMNT_0007346219 /DNA_START=346 /DNA_END=609 /DNA_ORIENTATION=+